MSGRRALARALVAAWYRAELRPITRLLMPASWLVCAVAWRRWRRHQAHPASPLPVPVLVVGNLTVGGSGKTPLVIALIEALRPYGWVPGVVSRGHGGGRSGVVPVSRGSHPDWVGDEAVHIVHRTEAPMWVGADRSRAARTLLAHAHPPVSLIIADDGLQHYRLPRDVEIAVIDGSRGFGNRRCLPAGPLREPLARLTTVDWCVVRGRRPADDARPGELPADCAAMQLVLGHARHLRTGGRRALVDFAGSTVHAIAGIANPHGFFTALREQGLQVIEHPFPDHHRYTASECAIATGEPIVMTEKDAVKCTRWADDRHWAVPATARLDSRFFDSIHHRLQRIAHDRQATA